MQNTLTLWPSEIWTVLSAALIVALWVWTRMDWKKHSSISGLSYAIRRQTVWATRSLAVCFVSAMAPFLSSSWSPWYSSILACVSFLAYLTATGNATNFKIASWRPLIRRTALLATSFALAGVLSIWTPHAAFSSVLFSVLIFHHNHQSTSVLVAQSLECLNHMSQKLMSVEANMKLLSNHINPQTTDDNLPKAG